jgi:hypothetical protein
MSVRRAKDQIFRLEMEAQILEIDATFNACVDDAERRIGEGLARECDLEKRLLFAESRLGETEREMEEVERRLRKLQKTPIVRFGRFVSRILRRAKRDGE